MAKSMTAMIKELRAAFGNLNTIDPSTPQYKRIIVLLNLLSQSQLKMIADADIKFISALARNRIKQPTKLQVEKADTDILFVRSGASINISSEGSISITGGKISVAGMIAFKTAEAEYQKAQYKYEQAKKSGKPIPKAIKERWDAARQNYNQAVKAEANQLGEGMNKINTSATVVSKLEALLPKPAPKPLHEVAASAVLFAASVEAARDGGSTMNFLPVLNRLASSSLSEVEIADRFTKAFGDVLLTTE